MGQIRVQHEGEDEDHLIFRVDVVEEDSSTTHLVRVSEKTLARFSDDANPAHIVEQAFHFLLDREPKESILNQFELWDIASYVPEFETSIKDLL